MESEIYYKMTKDDLVQALNEVIGSEIKETVYQKFAGRIVSAKTACEVLGIAQSTLYAYIQEGRINPIEPEKRNYKFYLSDLLRADIKKFQKTSNLKFRRESK